MTRTSNLIVVAVCTLLPGLALADDYRSPQAEWADKLYNEGQALLAKGDYNGAKEKFHECYFQLQNVDGPTAKETIQTADGPKQLLAIVKECKELAKTVTSKGIDRGKLDKTSYQLEPAATPDGPTRTRFACGETIYLRVKRVNASSGTARLEYQFNDGKTESINIQIYDPRAGDDPTGVNATTFLPDPADVSNNTRFGYHFYERVAALGAGKHRVKLFLQPHSGFNETRTELSIDCPDGTESYRKTYDKLRAAHLKTVRWPRTKLKGMGKWENMIASSSSLNPGLGEVDEVKTTVLDQRVLKDRDTGEVTSRVTSFVIGYHRPSDGHCFIVPGGIQENYDLLRQRYREPSVATAPGEFDEISCAELGVGKRKKK